MPMRVRMNWRTGYFVALRLINILVEKNKTTANIEVLASWRESGSYERKRPRAGRLAPAGSELGKNHFYTSPTADFHNFLLHSCHNKRTANKIQPEKKGLIWMLTARWLSVSVNKSSMYFVLNETFVSYFFYYLT